MINSPIQFLMILAMSLNIFSCQEPCLPNADPAFDSGAASIKKISSLKTTRSVHTATLLADGTVLIAGGMDNSQSPIKSAELYDPKTDTFQSIADMNTARVGHIAVLLKNGNVLIVGGFTGRRPTASAEIYDSKAKTFKMVGNMKVARGGHAGTLLQNGNVLISGSETGEKEVEIFNSETESFSVIGEMSVSRLAHTSTLLENGNVLIAGGSFDHNLTKTAEIFDKNSNKFSPAEEMPIPRHKHAAVLLDNGNVLIIGGSDEKDWNGQYSNALIYETKKGKFRALDKMNAKRFKIAAAAVRLTDGNIFIAGADEQSEVFNYKSETFIPVNGKMDEKRYYTTSTALKDGRVLIIGGYNRSIKNNGNAWIYSK